MKRVELGDSAPQFPGAVGNGVASQETGEQRFPIGRSRLAQLARPFPEHSRRCTTTIVARIYLLANGRLSQTLARPLPRLFKE
jgi:hypothetical protein